MTAVAQTVTWGIILIPPTPTTVAQPVTWGILSVPRPSEHIDLAHQVSWRIWSDQTIPLVLTGAPPGQIGVVTVTVTSPAGVVIYGPTTGGITETPTGATSTYSASIPTPTSLGTYVVEWTIGAVTATTSVLVTQPGFVQGFVNRRPPVRTDGIPWTSVAVMEGATRRGPFVSVATLPLDPVDADPADPVARDVITTEATVAGGWYALAWTDDVGHQHMTDPEYATNVITTTAA